MSKLAQLRRLIRESILSLLKEEDVKIYLQKGEKPPKGKKIQKGPRGGEYFTGTPEEKQAHKKGKSAPAAKPKVNIFDKPDSGKPKVKAKSKKEPELGLYDKWIQDYRKENPNWKDDVKKQDKPAKKKFNISPDVIKNSLPTDEYMDLIIDIEKDNMGDDEDSLAKDYTDVKNYINKTWPGAKMLSTEDDGGEDVGDIIDDLDGNNKPVSEEKFGDNLEVTDYGEAAVFRYNDIGGSMNTLIIKPKSGAAKKQVNNMPTSNKVVKPVFPEEGDPKRGHSKITTPNGKWNRDLYQGKNWLWVDMKPADFKSQSNKLVNPLTGKKMNVKDFKVQTRSKDNKPVAYTYKDKSGAYEIRIDND